MKKRRVTRYIAGVLSAMLLLSQGVERIVFAEESTVQNVVQGESGEAYEEAGAETGIQEEASDDISIPEETGQEDGISDESLEGEDLTEGGESMEAAPEEGQQQQTSETEAYQSVYTYEDNEVVVTAAVDQEGILPNDATVRAKKVEDPARIEKVQGLLADEAKRRDTGLVHYQVYDVAFFLNGEEIEPKGQVHVDIQFVEANTLAAASDGINTVQLFHVNAEEELEALDSDIKVSPQGRLEQVTFSSDEFSEYPVAVYGDTTYGESVIENNVRSMAMTQAAQLFRAGDSSPEEGLALDKKSVYNPDDRTAGISLEAYAKGEVITSGEQLPTDIVMVLDQSGSMEWDLTVEYTPVYNPTDTSGGTRYFIQQDGEYVEVEYTTINYIHPNLIYGWHVKGETGWPLTEIFPKSSASDTTEGSYTFFQKRSTTRMQALQSAVNEFLSEIRRQSSETINHRVAIVGFSGEYNTKLYIGDQSYSYGSWGMDSRYGSAFLDVNTQIDGLQKSIAQLNPGGETRSDYGMDMANKILTAYENKEPDTVGRRNKVVVMFTDGSPTKKDVFDAEVANGAISHAKSAKENHNATVYATGIIDGLDPTADPAAPTTAEDNRYMQYVSSNYPNAESLTSPGTGNYQAGYFMSAVDGGDLSEILQGISGSVGGSSSTLGTKAELKDYISDFFDMTNLQPEDIKVYTAAYKNDKTWGEKEPFGNAKVVIDKEKKSIAVSNFDYSQEYCMILDGKARGRKVIIELTVPVADGFIGGNDVLTNTSDAGIYDGDEAVKYFPLPTVDVPLLYGFSSQDKSIYLRENWKSVEQLFDDTKKAGIQYDLGGKEYTLDGKNNGFVNITYTVTDKTGETVGIYTIPAGQTTGQWQWINPLNTTEITEDTAYFVQVKIEPKDSKEGGVTETEAGKDAKLHIFKPTVAVHDKVIFYGETVDLEEHIGDVTWAAKDKNAALPEGKVPVLSYEYHVEGEEVADSNNYLPEKDMHFAVKVKHNDKDILAHTQIKNSSNPGNDQGFSLRVVKGQLAIEKKIDAKYTHAQQMNANQSFVFKIERSDTISGPVIDTFYEVISFDRAANLQKVSKAVTGLQKGYYTITEEESWSKKYSLINTGDNYDGNAEEARNVLIGERQGVDESGKPVFFGLEQKTYDSFASGTDARFEFTNKLSAAWKVLSDVAAAVNQFVK